MSKYLIFDMDGTIVNLYNVSNWLTMLQEENPFPYEAAMPMYNTKELANIINKLKAKKWQIIVVTWGAKNSSKSYNKKVAKAKKAWLHKYNFPYDKFYFQSYGTQKFKATKKFKGRQILIDDNWQVRKDWPKETIDATKDIIDELQQLLKGE